VRTARAALASAAASVLCARRTRAPCTRRDADQPSTTPRTPARASHRPRQRAAGGSHPTDVRMTTRFKAEDLTEGLTGAIHETGAAAACTCRASGGCTAAVGPGNCSRHQRGCHHRACHAMPCCVTPAPAPAPPPASMPCCVTHAHPTPPHPTRPRLPPPQATRCTSRDATCLASGRACPSTAR
jgi:hypothetical protein